MKVFGSVCIGIITAGIVLWTGIGLGWHAYGTRVQLKEMQTIQARQAQLNQQLIQAINSHHPAAAPPATPAAAEPSETQ